MAQTQDGASNFAEIIVTARKTEESLQDVPESVTVLSSAKIEDAGIVSVEDVGKLTPNISIDTGFSPAYTQITSRGITSPQGAEPPVALVIDGVQLSDVTFFNVDLINLERIEALRGPQGSLYGRNAIAGAINISTKRPTDDYSGMVKLSYANGEDYRAQAYVSGPIAPGALYFSLSGTYRNFDGNYFNDPDNRITVFPNPAFNGYFPDVGQRRPANFVEDASFRGALIYDDGGPITAELRGSFTDSEFGIFANELVVGPVDLNDDRSHLATNLDLATSRKLYEASLKFDYDIGDVTLTSVSYYNKADQITIGDGDFSTLQALVQNTGIDIESYSQELRLASNNDGPINWLIGGYYQDRKIRRSLILPFELNPNVFIQNSDDLNTSEAYAFFGQATAELAESLELTVGLRYDHDKRTSEDSGLTAPPNNFVGRSFDALQPKVSLKYEWNPDFQTYATIARGFRSGGFNPATSSQRLYEAETNWSYELGFKATLANRRLFLTGAVFYIELDDEQIYFVTTNPPAQNLTNIDKTSKKGIELEITAQPIDNLEISMGLGVARSTIEEFATSPADVGNRTPQVNSSNINVSIQYEIPLGGNLVLRPYAALERRGPIFWSSDNTFRTGERYIADARLFLEAGNWSLGAFAKNITNTRYPTNVGANSADFSPLGGPVLTLRGMNTPRSYGVEASYRF